MPVTYRRFIAERIVRHARVGRQLPRLSEHAGLAVARAIPVTAVFRDAEDADKVLGFQRVTERAVEANYLSPPQAQTWLSSLAHQPFFVSVTLFVVVADRTQ